MSTVIALTGFLGMPADWTDLIPEALVPTIPILPLWEQAEWLNAWAMTLPVPRRLAGYSLGGRLALHVLIQNPSIWSEAFILSSHTGLTDSLEKKQRLVEDQVWAERFRTDSWDILMNDWNCRGALTSSPQIVRTEGDYERERLAQSIDAWSLGRQEDLKPQIEELDLPITWVVGERDSSFCQIAQRLMFKHTKSRKIIVPEAGHRLLHEKPREIIKEWAWKH